MPAVLADVGHSTDPVEGWGLGHTFSPDVSPAIAWYTLYPHYGGILGDLYCRVDVWSATVFNQLKPSAAGNNVIPTKEQYSSRL